MDLHCKITNEPCDAAARLEHGTFGSPHRLLFHHRVSSAVLSNSAHWETWAQLRNGCIPKTIKNHNRPVNVVVEGQSFWHTNWQWYNYSRWFVLLVHCCFCFYTVLAIVRKKGNKQDLGIFGHWIWLELQATGSLGVGILSACAWSWSSLLQLLSFLLQMHSSPTANRGEYVLPSCCSPCWAYDFALLAWCASPCRTCFWVVQTEFKRQTKVYQSFTILNLLIRTWYRKIGQVHLAIHQPFWVANSPTEWNQFQEGTKVIGKAIHLEAPDVLVAFSWGGALAMRLLQASRMMR